MIELLVIAQLVTTQPNQTQSNQVPQSTYKAPDYSSPPPAPTSVPTTKQIEQLEEKLFDHPNG